MPDKIKFVLLFEGTGNSEDNPSVISRLYDKLKDTRTQRKHIVSGSGTLGGFIKRKFFQGCGLDSFAIIEKQYIWLTRHVNEVGFDWRKIDLYLFGFSRGAYQTEMFVDLISQYGVPTNTKDCARNVRLYKASLRRLFRGESRTATPWQKSVKYVGLFDAVSSIVSLGWYGKCAALPANLNGRHAISSNEIRSMFYPETMIANGRIRRKVFKGVHSDVGWGYSRTKVWGLIAAKWVLEDVENTLEFISTIRQLPDSFSEMLNLFVYSKAITNTSFTVGWWWLGWRRRKLNTRAFGGRHKTLRAIEYIRSKFGVSAPVMIWMPGLPRSWFAKWNSKRCEKVRERLRLLHCSLDPLFRNLKLY